MDSDKQSLWEKMVASHLWEILYCFLSINFEGRLQCSVVPSFGVEYNSRNVSDMLI